MTETRSPYACDACHSRKIACSRNQPKCRRCEREDLVCIYSRSGVIRRNRKKKIGIGAGLQPDASFDNPGEHSKNQQSHLATDIDLTSQRLNGLGSSQHGLFGALARLSDISTEIWHDEMHLEDRGKQFFLFEDQADVWVDAFAAALTQGAPLLIAAPPDVLAYLRACRPYLVRDRAWLVMYYSMILSDTTSAGDLSLATKKKLRCNLWLALNDARLLLEPSEVNIQALIMLACSAEDFTTPTLSWMLATTAFRMLETLGITNRHLDPQIRDRRILRFWHLNLLDKALALIFGRSPSFHPRMAREIPLPTLSQLLPNKAYMSSSGTVGLFGTHHLHQRLLLSRIMADIWDCLYGSSLSNRENIERVRKDLESWYQQAHKLLDAAAQVEKPLLDSRGAAAIDQELCSLSFSYHHLRILLIRFSDGLKTQCLDSCKEMLHLLKHIVTGDEGSDVGMVWPLLCNPFIPFLELFRQIVSKAGGGKQGVPDRQNYLEAMEQLPAYLQRMSASYALATKLERVATVFVQHAKCVVSPIATPDFSPNNSSEQWWNFALSDQWPSDGPKLNWDAFFDHALQTPFNQPQFDHDNIRQMDLEAWTSDFFGEAVLDWMGSDSAA